MKLFNKKNLNLSQSFKSGLDLYKNNFKLLVYISLLIFIVSFAYDTYQYYLSILKIQSYSGKTAFLSFIIFLSYIFLYSTLTITMVYVTYKLYKKEKVDFKEAFNFSKNRFWKYFWTSLKFILIILIPLLAEATIYNFVHIPLTKIILMIMFGVPLIYLVAVYNFAPTLSCLEEFGEEEFLQTSRNLVKGYIPQIIIVVFITQFLVWLPKYYFGVIYNSNENMSYVANVLNQVIFVVLNPLITAIYIVIINKLKENKLTENKRLVQNKID